MKVKIYSMKYFFYKLKYIALEDIREDNGSSGFGIC